MQFIWLFLFLVSRCQAWTASPATVLAALSGQSTPTPGGSLFLRRTPLIGGPEWLPLHVQVCFQTKDALYTWDFVPLRATEFTTLQRLVTWQDVPATVRSRKTTREGYEELINGSARDNVALETAVSFCNQYPGDRLHLANNNCWTFALQLHDRLLGIA